MSKQNITVSEATVNTVKEKDFAAQSMRDVISNYMESHALDTDTKALDSAVFKQYQSMFTKAKIEFDDAKNAMVTEFIPADLRDKVVNWTLNYATCELELILKED